MKNRRLFLKQSSLATAALIFSRISSVAGKNLTNKSSDTNNYQLAILHGIPSELINNEQIISHLKSLENDNKSIILLDNLISNKNYSIIQKQGLLVGIIHETNLSVQQKTIPNQLNNVAEQLKLVHNCDIVICYLSELTALPIGIEKSISTQSGYIDIVAVNNEKSDYEIQLNKFNSEVYISHNNSNSSNFKQIEICLSTSKMKNKIELKKIDLA
jgi:hypothetical protein